MSEDLQGCKVGHLVVLGFSHRERSLNYWVVKCVCGKEFLRRESHLTGKRAKTQQSCGCAVPHSSGKQNPNFRHGDRTTRTYCTWSGMKDRCCNAKNPRFEDYGGRGIGICESWVNNYPQFLADMGERPYGLSLDRIDNNKGYSKDNCRWATQKEQMSNTRSNVWVETEKGKLTLSEANRVYSLNCNHVSRYRRRFGISTQEAFVAILEMKRIKLLKVKNVL